MINMIKFIFKRKPLLFFIISFSLVTTILSYYTWVESRYHLNHEVLPIPDVSKQPGVNKNSLVYQMLEKEKNFGVTDDIELALYKYGWFFQEAMKIAPTSRKPKSQEVIDYFYKIQKLLDDYFRYEAGTLFADGLIRQAIDCDLRAYIFYDIAKAQGLDVSVVIIPKHAFITWKSETEMDVSWETTGNGGFVRIPRQVSQDGLFYRATTKEEILDLYDYLIANLMYHHNEKNKNAEKVLLDISSRLIDQYPDWTLLYESLLYISYTSPTSFSMERNKPIAEKIIEFYYPGNMVARYFLMVYYNNIGDMDAAAHHYKLLTSDSKNYEARKLYANTKSGLSFVFHHIDARLFKFVDLITFNDWVGEKNGRHWDYFAFIIFIWASFMIIYSVRLKVSFRHRWTTVKN